MNENQMMLSFGAGSSATVPSIAAGPSFDGRAASSFRPAARHCDRWFYELLDLACDGIEEAIQDLWLSYDHDFLRKGRGDE